MSAVLLDTHIVQWWSAEPERVSAAAREPLDEADELVVAAISWYELAWLARHERITVTVPVRAWLDGLASHLRTIGVTPAIAATAVGLPASFAGDPADRLIYATATRERSEADHQRPGDSRSRSTAVADHLVKLTPVGPSNS